MKIETMVIDDNVLIKYIDNTLSEEEKCQVETWQEASSENQKIVEQIYFTLQLIERIQVMNSVDTEKAFARFSLNIKRQKEKKRLGFSRLLGLQRIAAILFIPLLVLAGYLYMQMDHGNLQEVEMNTSPGVISTFKLPDGSTVWLNANSTLKYFTDLKTNKRIAQLDGEGYFEVVKDPKKTFIVKAGSDYSVKVLGTSFNVSAYAEEDFIETTLIEGSVKLDLTPINEDASSWELKPNEIAEYKKGDSQINISTVDPESAIGWKNGEIIFKQQPMEKVLRTLSRHYNVQFDIKDPNILNAIITAKFKNEQLPQIMEYLKVASGIKFTVKTTETTNNNVLKKSIIEIDTK